MFTTKRRRHPVADAASPQQDAEVLHAIVESAGPLGPPSEDEILSLILGELPRAMNRKRHVPDR